MNESPSGSTGREEESALRAIASLKREKSLSGLLVAIIEISLEETGAERAVLLLPEGDEWFVEAEAGVSIEPTTPREPLEGCRVAPPELVDWVLRSAQAIIVDDAANDSRFGSDPYVRERKVRSGLCYPVVDDDEVVLALYLEDNRRPCAFSDDLIAFLDALSPHIAIALGDVGRP